MTRATTLRLIAATPLIALLAACSGEVAENGDSDPVGGEVPAEIAERQDNFEAIKDNFSLIRAELETDAPDFAAIEAAAADINTRAGAIEGHFPAGSGRDAGFDSEALASIWERPEDFAAAQQKLIEQSAAMVTIAATGDAAAVGAQVGELGGSCKNCHDQFRLDDD